MDASLTTPLQPRHPHSPMLDRRVGCVSRSPARWMHFLGEVKEGRVRMSLCVFLPLLLRERSDLASHLLLFVSVCFYLSLKSAAANTEFIARDYLKKKV